MRWWDRDTPYFTAGWATLLAAVEGKERPRASKFRSAAFRRALKDATRTVVPLRVGDKLRNAAIEAVLLAHRPPNDDPVSIAISRERKRGIHSALRALNPLDRLIVRLRYGMGDVPWSEEEIATAFGITRTRVWQRLQRSESKLRPLLLRFATPGGPPRADQ